MGSMFDNLVVLGTVGTALPFVIIGLILLVIGLRRRAEATAASSWPSTTGTVLAAEVASYRGSGRNTGTYYVPAVVYQYDVDGKRYHGNKYSVGATPGRGSYTAVQNVVDAYHVGGSVEVFYDPNDPSRAALHKTAPSASILLVVAIGMIGFSLLMVAVMSFIF